MNSTETATGSAMPRSLRQPGADGSHSGVGVATSSSDG